MLHLLGIYFILTLRLQSRLYHSRHSNKHTHFAVLPSTIAWNAHIQRVFFNVRVRMFERAKFTPKTIEINERSRASACEYLRCYRILSNGKKNTNKQTNTQIEITRMWTECNVQKWFIVHFKSNKKCLTQYYVGMAHKCVAVVWHINCYVVAITTNQFLITKQQYNNPTESNSEPAFTFGLTIFLQLVRVWSHIPTMVA